MFNDLFKPSEPLATLRAMRALLTFCERQHYLHPDLEHVRTAIRALEQGRHKDAAEEWEKIYLGKDGFGDWWPPQSSQDGDYDWTVFQSLLERADRLMTLVKKGQGV